jgi:hypothetical protein
MVFFFHKIREQEGRTGSSQGVVGWHQWEGGCEGERGKRMNMMQIIYKHVCKCKTGIRGGGIKEGGVGVEFKYDIFDTL